jgi:hypothetical protein
MASWHSVTTAYCNTLGGCIGITTVFVRAAEGMGVVLVPISSPASSPTLGTF